jgi:hypothetical protein
MREQRHAARANRERAEAADRRGPADADAPPPQAVPPRAEVPARKAAESKGGADAPDYAELNAYMREQRHAARANREKVEAMERARPGDAPPEAVQPQRAEPPAGSAARPADSPDYTELNAYMREQRHAARANRERAEALERRGFFDGAEPPPPEKPSRPPKRKPEEGREQADFAELNAYMREQRHAARANREKAEAERRGVVDPAPRPPPEPEPQAPKRRAEEAGGRPDYAELNAYMREQRHAARANKARAEGSDKPSFF